MDIDNQFTFGKYKGLTLTDVFSGTEQIDRDVLQAYLIHRLDEGDISSIQEEITTDMFNFEISQTIIRSVPTLPDFKGNWSKYIEDLFQSATTFGSRLAERSLDKFYFESYYQEGEKKQVMGGNPEYIEWCIKKVDGFYIDPKQIDSLQERGVNWFRGIIVVHKTEDIYEYFPKVEYKKYKFSDRIIGLNNSKAML